MPSRNCPKCDADISDSYEPPDYDCGINPGWYCDACDLAVGDDGEREPMEGDVQIFGTGVGGGSHVCACGAPYEMGYGLAGGGGLGPYMYCPRCGTITQKSSDPEGKPA